MGFAISLACCEAGDCHYLSNTLPDLEPLKALSFLSLPVLDVSAGQKLLLVPGDHNCTGQGTSLMLREGG